MVEGSDTLELDLEGEKYTVHLKKLLGKGGYARVFLASNKEGKYFACKRFTKKLMGSIGKLNLQREIASMTSLRGSSYSVQFIG